MRATTHTVGAAKIRSMTSARSRSMRRRMTDALGPRMDGGDGETAGRAPGQVVVVVTSSDGGVVETEVEDEDVDDLARRLAAIVESSSDAIMSKTLDGVLTSWY